MQFGSLSGKLEIQAVFPSNIGHTSSRILYVCPRRFSYMMFHTRV